MSPRAVCNVTSGRLQIGVQGDGAAAGLPLTRAVGHVEHLRDLPLRIGDHRLRE